MIKIFHKTKKDFVLNEIEELKPHSWLFVENPTDSEIQTLIEKYRLDEGLLRDSLDPFEVPRIELDEEENITYVFTRVPHKVEQEKRIYTFPLMIAIAKDFLVTVSSGHGTHVLNKFIDEKNKTKTTDTEKLFLQIFFEINRSYNSFLNSISRQVRGNEIKLEEIENRDVIRFFIYENTISDFLTALVPTNTLLKSISLSKRLVNMDEEEEELFEDLFLGNGQLIELCRSNLKYIVSLREAHSTILTNNLNRVIKLLTILTIVLTVPTIVSSFFGMNVPVPLANNPGGFWLISSFTIALIFILGIIFVKNKWL